MRMKFMAAMLLFAAALFVAPRVVAAQERNNWMPEALWTAFLRSAPPTNELVDVVISAGEPYKKLALQELIKRQDGHLLAKLVAHAPLPYDEKAWTALHELVDQKRGYHPDPDDFSDASLSPADLIRIMIDSEVFRERAWGLFMPRELQESALSVYYLHEIIRGVPEPYKEKAWEAIAKRGASDPYYFLDFLQSNTARNFPGVPDSYRILAAQKILEMYDTGIASVAPYLLFAVVRFSPQKSQRTQAWERLQKRHFGTQEDLRDFLLLLSLVPETADDEFRGYAEEITRELFWNGWASKESLGAVANYAPEPYRTQASQLLELLEFDRDTLYQMIMPSE